MKNFVQVYLGRINVFPHTDCGAVFVVRFGVGYKAVFLIESKNIYLHF